MRVACVLSVAVCGAVLTGCGGTDAPAAAAPPVAVTQPAPTVTVTETAPTGTGAERPERPAPVVPKSRRTAERILPDVVGMNLQKGQDTMQAAGFYILDDQDATGRKRLQIFDRNWVVTKQVPPAGKKVPLDTRVILYAKKIGE
ncbi:hypothetical protein GCM10017673_25940 [Streptosporangium violaceochromogenes]|nr:hypothetical protein GCM10017673_25940 [Streptosporangium violaceochromogenes]